MCIVFEPNRCPQCRSHSSTFTQDHRSGGYETSCGRCGHREYHESKYDDEGIYCGFHHDVRQGFGVLFFRYAGDREFYLHSLNTPGEVNDSELWLRQRLASGVVDADTASLTRWNDEDQRMEVVLGERVDLLAGRVVRRSGVPEGVEHDNQDDQSQSFPRPPSKHSLLPS